jgi:peptidoglycan/xylan/chitin deacetylase (PgdA/CDA1 family)
MSTPHARFAALALGSFLLGGGVAAFARGGAAAAKPAAKSADVAAPPSAVVTRPEPPAARGATQIDGRAFPDGVLALTWDDGPDVNTLALAEYLAREHVAATFFVVNEWVADLSSDPGSGHGVYETGYQNIPILGDLVRLGHRLGNHTLNHVLLADADPALVDLELRANQEQLDPFLTNELRMFRVPGGAWSADAANVVADDPALRGMVGPIRWDVDRKDWENAVGCNSDHPATECERTTGGASRVKASVTAERYLASIDEAKHGIVLFHDRVGDVGSDYAMQIARAIVPHLQERGYVFAAPVLAFSPLKARAGVKANEGATLTGDLNGDGRTDECHPVPEGFACALATNRGFTQATVWMRSGSVSRAWLADVNGDGRADLCVDAGNGAACGLAP